MLASCQKDIELDLTEFEPNLVVNGIFNPDEYWKISISKSANIFDVNSYIEKIDDANVSVENLTTGEITQLVHTSDISNKGIYFSTEYPKEFVNYRLLVEKDGFESATAIDQIPTEIDVEFIDTSLVEVEGELALQIDFTINDNEGEENFYVWDLVYSEEDNGSGNILDNYSDATLESVDDNTEIINDETNVHSRLFLSDGNFNGSNYSTTFLTHDKKIVDSSNPSTQSGSTNLKLKLRVLSVSSDLYDYLKSVEASYRSQDINTSNLTPIDIASNVEGGIGIFGGYKMHLVDIE